MTFQRSSRTNGAAFWLLFGGLLVAACAKKPEPEQVRQAVEKASPAAAGRPSEEEAEADSEDGAEAPSAAAPEPTANAPTPIDRARIPVSEDFASDAENQITAKSNLERELARIASEIKANPSQAAERKAEKN